jgi:hypothetical protein
MRHELIENRKMLDSVFAVEKVLIPDPKKMPISDPFSHLLFRAKARLALSGIFLH